MWDQMDPLAARRRSRVCAIDAKGLCFVPGVVALTALDEDIARVYHM
jgi:hypothetical protein